jgi:hypothetical protein
MTEVSQVERCLAAGLCRFCGEEPEWDPCSVGFGVSLCYCPCHWREEEGVGDNGRAGDEAAPLR